MSSTSLEDRLAAWAGRDQRRLDVAATIRAIAAAVADIAAEIADGPLAGDLAAEVGKNVQGEVQKALDVHANDRMIEACRQAPVAAVASEELDHPLVLDALAPLLVATDPLDGSSNIDTNVAIGTIFSILAAPPDFPALVAEAGDTLEHGPFLQPGRAQLAAGYAVYGPHVSLALTVGEGTWLFTLERRTGRFLLTAPAVEVPAETHEFAINAANSRHWDEPIRIYVADCLAGQEGPRGVDFNMRWVASLVADCHRILVRGGVYLYPSDRRRGYHEGRLRLIYEANPVSLLVEQAGGLSSTGAGSILDVEPSGLHQRIPFIFGSRAEIERIEHHHAYPHADADHAPLFGKRGLFRA